MLFCLDNILRQDNQPNDLEKDVELTRENMADVMCSIVGKVWYSPSVMSTSGGFQKNVSKQESPPVWTQEAYRPPHSCSKCLLFQGAGGTPDLGWGTPPTWTWDGVPPTWTWDGVPPPPGPGMGYPLPGPGMGYPPTWTWDGVPPYLDLGWGTPPSDRTRVPPLPSDRTGVPPCQTGPGYPPTPCGQTHRQVSKHYLPVVLRTRAVKICCCCWTKNSLSKGDVMKNMSRSARCHLSIKTKSRND